MTGSADGGLRSYDVRQGQLLTSYFGHTNKRVKVRSTLDPTDSFVVSGQQGHAAAVLCVAFYEETLVSASADGVVKWRRPPSGC
eukprot:g17478.t1